MRTQSLAVGLCTLTAAVLAPDALSQGTFVNYETPQVKPITVAHANGHDWLLACSTPDNSVDVYDASAPYTHIKRVPVGLGPVTVRWNEDLGRFYVCNFDGDSVTTVRLDSVGASVNPVVENTTFVGDEPCDIAFTSDNVTAFITLNSRKSVTQRVAANMSMVVPEGLLNIPGSGVIAEFVVKQPRVMEMLPDGRTLIANFMGETPLDPVRSYDVDFYYYDPAAVPNTINMITNLGTTNHSFAVRSDGSRMFVVGTRARHNAPNAVGVAQVAALPTGFVQSWMWVVDIPQGATANVVPEAPATVLPAPIMRSINLNRDYAFGPLTGVPAARALAQPTDILLWEDPDSELMEKVFVTAYHSDVVASLTPDSTVFGGWRVNRIPLHAPAGQYSAVGPRGLTASYTATDPDLATPGLLYALNRLDNSVSVIDPATEVEIASFPLSNDPTPANIRAGREFLYSARFSGNGAVSCASCHVDGRTDGLPWNLGNIDPIQPSVDPWTNDGTGLNFTNFPTDKGLMMTQTLQGLVNHPVNVGMQGLFTNAPYHWRGDKRSVNEFNEAYVNLQGMPNIGTPADPRGVSVTDMQTYVDFVNTIRHPPNYEEPIDRIPTGSLDPANPQNPNSPLASGARLGLQIYNNNIFADGKTCTQCHSPDAGDGDMTLAFAIAGTLQPATQAHPMQAAAVRNLIQREATLHAGFTQPITNVIGNSGLLHSGDPSFGGFFAVSINGFIWQTFRPAMPGGMGPLGDKQAAAVTEFIRQFDTGIAPAAGLAYTLDLTIPPLNAAMFNLLEDQVFEANVGLAAYTRNGGIERGYWFDTTVSPAQYREQGTANLISRAALSALAAGPGNVVILQGTPVGSERRVASLTGVPATMAGSAPTNLAIEAMAPAKHWLDVTLFTGNITAAPNFSLRTRDEFWKSITSNGGQGRFGIPNTRRHEPPRRFRVTGDNIRPGAVLFLGMAGPGGAPQSNPQYIALPLFPTRYTVNGRQVWETTVEAGSSTTLGLLSGGVWADGVAAVATGNYTPVPPLNAPTWNFYTATVFNEDLTFGVTPSWQPLTVQDTR